MVTGMNSFSGKQVTLNMLKAGKNFCSNFIICRTYLSSSFRDAIEKPYESRPRSEQSLLDADNLVHNLNSGHDLHTDVGYELLQLRSKGETAKTFPALSHAVVRHFVHTNSVNDLLPIISNRLDYGVFLDKFIGIYLLNHLLVNQDYAAAAQVAAEIYQQEDYDNSLVIALSLKAFFDYLKAHVLEPIDEPAPKEKPKGKVTETKIRVKFIRNYSDEFANENERRMNVMGKAIIKMSNASDDGVKWNMKLIGSLLSNQHQLFFDVIRNHTNVLNSDVLNLCLNFIKKSGKSDEEMTNALNVALQISSNEAFAVKLDALMSRIIGIEQPTLMEELQTKRTQWLAEREKHLNEVAHQKSKIQSQTKIDNLLVEIQQKKEMLWFYDLEDELDLKIYNKKVIYPKRWFGKKKKPRVVDEGYIPPETKKKIVG